MTSHGYLDKFTFLNHCLYAEGWASDFDAALYYDGIQIEIQAKKLKRPDLVSVFGKESIDWGFAFVAILPIENIEHDKFTLRFSKDLFVDNPSSRFSCPGDVAFGEMVSNFRNAVARKKGSMIEIGSRARSGASYRSWFPDDITHLGIDITDGPCVDLVADAHHLSRSVSDRFDFAFSMAVFEHILMPWKVALELNSVLKDGAIGLIISHAAWPLHEEPWDFFRFSKESWRGIFNKHTGFEIIDAQYQYPASITPNYVNDPNFGHMSQSPTYLLSGCSIRKIGRPQVSWDAEVSEVYDLSYSHA